MCRRSAVPADAIRLDCRRASTVPISFFVYLKLGKCLAECRSEPGGTNVFFRLISDSFTRRPRRKVLTGAALALGMAVATAALSVSLDVGDRLAREFRSLGANLIVTPAADSLPLEIGGVDYRPVNAGAYLPESDLPKIKTVFWHNNIIAFAPSLEIQVHAWTKSSQTWSNPVADVSANILGTWASQLVPLADGGTFTTGIAKTNPWWQLKDGAWFNDSTRECVVGSNLQHRAGIKVGDALNVRTEKHAAVLKVTGVLSTGGSEDDEIVAPLAVAQEFANTPGQYRKLYVSALTKPEDDFARRDRKTMTPEEFERWSCSPYVSSIAYSIQQALPGSDVRVIRRVAEGEGMILTRVRVLLWLVTGASLLAAALAVGASSAASVIERRNEIGLMKALGAASSKVGLLLVAEQLLLAVVGGGLGYALGIILARVLGQTVFGVAPEPSLLVLAVVLALAAAVTLLGSAVPLRRASRLEPAPILRGE
jgi:putative ABC transport system permease protein